MNYQSTHRFQRLFYCATVAVVAGGLASCSSSTTSNPPAAPTTTFSQTNLVSDTSSIPAKYNDPLLVNAWGLGFSSTGRPWISANGSFTSTFYDTSGGAESSITIPKPGGGRGAPSGLVFNGTSSAFGGNHFLFSTEDGTILGWSSGSAATIVSDSSGSGAVYKGLAIVPSQNLLYATDFHNNVVVVFNSNFGVQNSFTDHTLPAGYGPFGIQNIKDTLYVTFARLDYLGHDDSAGTGIGYVDRFTPSGTMIGRFASNGNLNSPWGTAQAPASWGQFANAILIGNFGDGKITGYTSTGTMIGQLSTSSGTLSIDGLWALEFNPTSGFDPNKLYFTSGPDGENHGLFGYLDVVP